MIRNSRRRLHADYKAVYTNMCMYLQGKAINTWCMRRIREDILDIALDNQTRGVSAKAAFGDYQSFCDAVSQSSLRQTMPERLFKYIGFVLAAFVYCVLLGAWLSPQYELHNNTFIIYGTSLLEALAVMLAIVLAWYGRARYILRYPNHKIAIYFLLYIAGIAITCILLQFLGQTSVYISARLLILIAGIAVLCLAAAYGSERIRYHKAGIS